MKFSLSLAALAASLALAGPAAAGAPAYTIVDLGRPTGNNVGHADGVSSNGSYVVGRGVVGNNQAFIWSESTGAVSLLPGLAGYNNSWAVSANDSGLVVGMVSTAATTNADATAYSSAVPVVWKNGVATTLAASGRVYSVNNSGLAVGSIGAAGTLAERAVVYDTGSGSYSLITAAAADGSTMRTGLSISNAGVVVGTGVDTNGTAVTLAYDTATGTMKRIASLDGSVSPTSVKDVNDNGIAVGTLGTGTLSQVYSWSALAGLSSVALPAGMVGGTAMGINDDGWVVGYAKNGVNANNNLFLTTGTSSYLLQGLITNSAGWNFASSSAMVMGIADDGTIVGYTQFTADGNRIHGFALLPSAVPEPASYALMLGGLLAIGAVARRRQHSA